MITSLKNLALYLIKYVAKSEKQTNLYEKLMQTLQRSNTQQVESVLKKTLLQANTRDISSQEAAYILLFQSLVLTSVTPVYINTSNNVEFLPDGTMSTNDCEVYINRPTKDEDLTMQDFYSIYSRRGKSIFKR